MDWIGSNKYLSQAEQTINANYIFNSMSANGWTKEAICGILGNMQTESTMNPGLWESMNAGNMSVGYGLVQWTPASKYINWAQSLGKDYNHIDSQLARIEYEIANGIQWITTSSYPLSFQQFKASKESPEYLAEVFIHNYERPANANQPLRGTQARYWFNTITGEGGSGVGGSTPAFPTEAGLQITDTYGWRTNPVTGEYKFHAAIDIGGGGSQHPLYATQDGIVVENREVTNAGYGIRIKHTADPYYSQYLHMNEPSPIPVGTAVTKGQEIGTMGNGGNSTGIHLDFAIATSQDGFFTEEGTIDPEKYLQMMFGGGSGGDGGNDEAEKKKKAVYHMLLADTLNGWRF
jgi:murein DD-endopeptidase MepM/ murein hydrolase activator NlpD